MKPTNAFTLLTAAVAIASALALPYMARNDKPAGKAATPVASVLRA